MIKRPLLWGIASFIIGILLAWYKASLLLIILIGFTSWLLIYLMMFRLKKYLNRQDWFLWGLPLILLLGFLAMGDRMKPPDMDRAFDDEAECILSGDIKMIVNKSWGTSYYLKNNRISLTDDSTYLVEEILVNVYENQLKKYRIGNKITVSGTIKKFKPNSNPGNFNEYLYYKAQNISYKVAADEIILTDEGYSEFHYILNNIKDKLVFVYNSILPQKEAGTLMAMLLGEKYLLEDEIKALYRENGISHILAISGLHVSLLGAAMYLLLRKLKLGLIASTVLSLLFIYSYGILTNFSVSTNRAVVMYSILLLAKIFGKTFDILSALSLSAFVILLQNPLELFQTGFLLSFAAVLGIAVVLPGLNRIHDPKSPILKAIYVSASAQVLTLPIVLYFFFQIPTYSIIVNLLILPLTSLLMLIAMAAGILGIVSVSLGVFVAGGANYILLFYETVCRLGSNAPGSLITLGRPDMIRILMYFAIILIFICCARRCGRKRTFLLVIAAVAVLIIPRPRDGLTIIMLDVGQGEAIYMESDSGTSYFIDGGSSDVNQVGRYRIEPFLLAGGTDTIDYAIVTHTDVDHINGLTELIQGRQISINNIILPDTASRNEAYGKLEAMAREKDIKLSYIVTGDRIMDGKLEITFLHPPKGYRPASNNDYSAVISISYDDFDMLITGDIEAKGERELLKHLTAEGTVPSDYDVLKVAHHGSKNSTGEELLAIIKPELSLISCGKDNRYGHPHEELLERLRQVGSNIIITFKSGAITLRTNGRRMQIEEYLTQ